MKKDLILLILKYWYNIYGLIKTDFFYEIQTLSQRRWKKKSMSWRTKENWIAERYGTICFKYTIFDSELSNYK